MMSPGATVRWAMSLALLTVCAAAAQAESGWADWREARPFLVRADFKLQGIEPLLTELQQLQQELVGKLHVPPALEPIEIYLFQSETAYREYLQARYPQAPPRRALFVKASGPGQVFAYRSDQFEIDLRHETTHALLHASLTSVPLWLDEGLAEYFEVPAADRPANNPHLKAIKWNLWTGWAPRLSGLEEKRDLSEMGKREYMFAWGWVHYMLHGSPEAKEELIQFLHESQHGLPATPLSQRLTRRLPNPEKRLAQHFMRQGGNMH